MMTVILTGGASRRMGRDKAMLPWNGGTMLQYLINKYSAAFGSVAVSVNMPGRFSFTGARELVDIFPNMGPMNGILSAFEATDADEIFMTGTDLPYGEPKLVERLRQLMGDADACIIKRGVKGIEPLFAIYRRTCRPVALHCMENGLKSLRELLERVNVRYVEPSELSEFDLEKILMNINTMDEYEKTHA